MKNPNHILSSERDNQSSGLGDSLAPVDYGLEELSQQIVERLLDRIQDGDYNYADASIMI